jgi:hypothetical protein
MFTGSSDLLKYNLVERTSQIPKMTVVGSNHPQCSVIELVVALTTLSLGVLASRLINRTASTEAASVRGIAISFSYNTTSMMANALGACIGVSAFKTSSLQRKGNLLVWSTLTIGITHQFTWDKLCC